MFLATVANSASFMDVVLKINKTINDIVWGPAMLVLLIGVGLFLSVRTKFVALRKIGFVLKSTVGSLFKKEDRKQKSEHGELSPFQALSTALAATVGTGNVAGVATAIALGGPGAVFWMWMAAVVGMTTKFAEIVLALDYREISGDGRIQGGPMYYLKHGIKFKTVGKVLAFAFALFGAIASFGIGDMVQANSITTAVQNLVGSQSNSVGLVTGIIIAVLALIVLLGGVKRIGQITSILVPFMALFYIIGGLIIIIANISNIPASFALIFQSAFTGEAASGGFAGATVMMAIRYGLARGVFTNEAGLGSSPIAHATAKTNHPVEQGMWGIFEVFIDTIVICSMTALVIISTGVWNSGADGAELTIKAFNAGLPGNWGGNIVSIGLVLFAFSTILGWSIYGASCAEYLFGSKVRTPYLILYCGLAVVGAIGGLKPVWAISDTLNALMAIPNLIGLALLSGIVIKNSKEYFENGITVRQSGIQK